MLSTIRRSYFGAGAVLVATVLLCVLAGSSAASPGVTSLVSVDSSGNPANDHSGPPAISADGRFVAFSSNASNLVENDANYNGTDIVVRDLQEGTTELVSVDSFGNQWSGSGGLTVLGISADGRFVVFFSDGSAFVEDDTNNTYDIFVHDRQTRTTERVNVDSSENQSIGDPGGLATETPLGTISADGRFVVFTSNASDLVQNDTNSSYDVFLRDLQEGTTELVSVDSSENQFSGFNGGASISANGRYVAFYAEGQIVVRDLQEGTTELVSVDSSLVSGAYTTISADGRFVTFDTSNGLFVRDRLTELNHQVNLINCATGSDVFGGSCYISADGRYVAFASRTLNDNLNILLRDMHTGITEPVSVDSSGNPADDHSFWHSVSTDGSVAFTSNASNLVENDTNNSWDVFLHVLQTAQLNDDIAPTTTACGYANDTWTNQDVQLTFSAQDNEEGSGVKDIRYSATGAQSIPETVYNTYNSPLINTEGTTTISYFATDNAGNRELPARTLTVKLDKTPPKVSSTSPLNNATGVAATAKVSAKFLESGSGIDPDSLNADTFSVVQLKPTGNVPVSGTISYDEDSKTAIFTPSRGLAKGAYQASISVNDKAGNLLANDIYTWRFATAGPSSRR